VPDLRGPVCGHRHGACAQPGFWVRPGARILIAGRRRGCACTRRQHPFTDASGDRLRDWMGVDEDTFYDRAGSRSFPWRSAFRAMTRAARTCRRRGSAPKHGGAGHEQLPHPPDAPDRRYAQRLAPGRRESVTARVAAWRDHAPDIIPLPHPSWRNTAWLKRNPWFEAELLPVLRTRVREVLE
jgi:uracil-DNA glycosylase